MQVNNSAPSFGSTKLIMPKNADFGKALKNVGDYFELKGFAGEKYILKPQLAADQIDFSQAAIIPTGKAKGEFLFVGKDGGEGGADTFIGRILAKAFPNQTTFVDDIAPIKLEGPYIDMTKIHK